jgi:hypothetical protein
MSIARRSILRMFASAPLVAKATADKAVANLTGIASEGLQYGGGCAPSGEGPKPHEFAAFLRNAVARREIETILYREQERMVGAIDPDLAALRSFSLNAKITFQRQRNVARRLEEMQRPYSWDRIADMVRNPLKAFGTSVFGGGS